MQAIDSAPEEAARAQLRAEVRSWLETTFFAAVILAALAVGITLLDVPSYVAPSPGALLRGIIRHRETLMRNLVPTVVEAGGGFVIGNVAAFVVSALAVQRGQARRLMLSFALFLRSVPIIALTPVLTLWLGLFLAPKLCIVALLTFFPTLIVTIHGLTSVDPLIMELLSALQANRRQIFRKVRMPAAVPYVFAGLKIAAPTAVSGALVAEWLGANQGLGHIMATAAFEYRTDLLWATILTSSVLGILAYGAVVLLQRVLFRWSLE